MIIFNLQKIQMLTVKCLNVLMFNVNNAEPVGREFQATGPEMRPQGRHRR
jgi:hypothetical protein